MSRLHVDDECSESQAALWWANIERQAHGKRGQVFLRAMEAALLALPDPVLVRRNITRGGAVCAVGAYVAHAVGGALDLPIADAIDRVRDHFGDACTCHHMHAEHEAGSGPCRRCRHDALRGWNREPCGAFHLAPQDDDEEDTTEVAEMFGVPRLLAWALVWLNDEAGPWRETDAQRYERVLGWVRARLVVAR